MKMWSSLVETAQEIYIDVWSGVVLVHAISNMREWRYICSFHVLALCGRFSPCERTPSYPLSRRLGGFRNLSGRFGEWEWCPGDIFDTQFIYLIQRRVSNLKRLRQPKQTYGMEAHVVQGEVSFYTFIAIFRLVVHIAVAWDIHLPAVLLQRSLLRLASFYQHDVGRP